MSNTQPSSIPTILPLSECSTEVLKAAAQTVYDWAALVSSTVARDEARTPLSDTSKQAMELVHRMKDCEEFRKSLEIAAEVAHRTNETIEDNIADAIFWFTQGWLAAATAMEQRSAT